MNGARQPDEALRALWPALPATAAELELARFKRWLAGGCIETQNSHVPERLLYLLEPRSWGAIDALKSGALRWIGAAPMLYLAFLQGVQAHHNRPLEGFQKPEIVAFLRVRDGDGCWYCGLPVDRAGESIEHLLSRSCGGGDHPSNLALAHRDCNHLGGALPLAQKVALRDRLRGNLGTAP